MRKLKRVLGPTLVPLACALVSTTAAAADVRYPPPVTVPGSSSFSEPHLAADAAGHVDLAWAADSEIRFVQYLRDGTFGPVRVVSDDPVPGFAPEIAVDADGRATIVWLDSAGVETATVAANGSVGAERTLVSGRQAAFRSPRVAVDQGGQAAVVWEQLVPGSDDPRGPHKRVQVVMIGADGDPGQVRTLSGGGSAFGARLTLDRGGRTTVVWQRRPAGQRGGEHIETTRLSPGGKPGQVRRLSPRGVRTQRPDLVADRLGRVTVAWEQTQGNSDRIKARRLDRDGVPGRTRTLSPHHGGYAAFVDLVADERGRVSVGWVRRERIEVVRFTPGGAPGKLRSIDDGEARFPSGPALAVDPAGRVVVAWSHCCTPGKTDVKSSLIGSNGVPGRPLTVATGDDPSRDIDQVVAVMDSRGRPTLAWSSPQIGIQLTRSGGAG